MRFVILLLSLVCMPAFAVVGRLANVESQPDLSAEGQIEFGDNGYMGFILGGTYKLSPDLLGSARLNLFDTDGGDGKAFGFAALYQVHDLIDSVDTAAIFSFDRFDFDNAGNINQIVIGFLVSGRNGLGGGGNIYPYGNLFLARSSGGGNSDTDIGFGGGVVVPTATGEFYGGIDVVDDPSFGFGFRYFLQ